MLAADLHHRIARIRLPQYAQNLLFTVTALAHTSSPLVPESHATTEILNFNLAQFLGFGSPLSTDAVVTLTYACEH
jgi:hypothetical protein